MESEATNLLGLRKVELRGMAAEDCFEGSVLLQGFAFHLQRAINRAKSISHWADENVRSLIAPIVGQVKGWAYEERRPLAVQEHALAKRLENIRVQYQLRAQSIEYLSSKVEQYGRFLGELGQEKRRKHGQS